MTAITFDLTQTVLSASTVGFNSLASSASQVAGAQTSAIDLTTGLQLEYIVEGLIRWNATSAPTANTVGLLYSAFSEDGTNFEGGGIITATGSGAKTLTEGEREQLTLIASMRPDASTGKIWRASATLLTGRFGRLTIPKSVVFWLTHNSGQTLHSASHAIYLYPRNFV